MKSGDTAIVEVEIIEYLQQLKVHRMFLKRYLEEEKM